MINKKILDKIRKANYINKYSTINNKIKLIKQSINIENIKQSYKSNNNIKYETNNSISKVPLYATEINQEVTEGKTHVKSILSEGKNSKSKTKLHSNLPPDDNEIYIPKKVKRYLAKNVRLDELRAIDKDVDAAREKLLLVVSLLSTQLVDEKRYWRRISHTLIQILVRKGNDNTNLSGKVVRLLERHSIIEVKKKKDGSDDYEENKYPRRFRLSKLYFEQNLVKYELKNRAAIENKMIAAQLNKNDFTKSLNPIIQNLAIVYDRLTIPSTDEIHQRAKELIKQGYTKRQKKLIYKGKKERQADKYSYVEEHIEIFEYLIKSVKTPTVSSQINGYRIIDFINLMPSWIRQLIKIDDEEIAECDFKCMHPNLAVNIYGGKSQFITHQKIAEELNIPLETVKKEHLSFFNCHENQMVKSILHKYYLDNEPDMLQRIKRDKKIAEPWYKRTSMKLLGLEVQLMTEIIKRLNSQGIYVLYVYDALYGKKSEADLIKKTMNEVALEMKIYTTA